MGNGGFLVYNDSGVDTSYSSGGTNDKLRVKVSSPGSMGVVGLELAVRVHKLEVERVARLDDVYLSTILCSRNVITVKYFHTIFFSQLLTHFFFPSLFFYPLI